MKEVFLLLPMKSEALFKPAPKQTEKRVSPFEDEKPFRDYLEQAKSAPRKSLVKHENIRSAKFQREEIAPLPGREEFESKAQVEDSSTLPETTDVSQTAAAQPMLPDPVSLTGLPSQRFSTLDRSSTDAEKLFGEQVAVSLEGAANSALLSSSGLPFTASLTPDVKNAQAGQDGAVEKALPQVLQVADEPAPPLPAVEGEERTTLQLSVSVKETIMDELGGDDLHLSNRGSKEMGKATGGQTPESAGEKSSGVSPAVAQERLSGKAVVAEISRSGETEARSSVTSETNPRLSSVKEGAKPQAVQASGPPVNTATAKPIEPARLAEAHRPEIVQQVARELEIFGKSGQTSLRIQLYPEQLGRIDVRLISNADGVQIVIRADNPSTASLLERDLNFLRESLVQAGVNLSGLTVSDGQAQTRSDLTQSEFHSPRRNGERLGDSSVQSNQAERSAERSWSDSSSTLDYRI